MINIKFQDFFPNCGLRFQEPSYGTNKDMDKTKIQDTENVFGKKKMEREELFKTCF